MLRVVPWSCVASPEVGFTGSETASSYYSSGEPGVFGLHMRLYYKNPFIELDPWQTVSPERAAARYGIYGSRLRFPRGGSGKVDDFLNPLSVIASNPSPEGFSFSS